MARGGMYARSDDYFTDFSPRTSEWEREWWEEWMSEKAALWKCELAFVIKFNIFWCAQTCKKIFSTEINPQQSQIHTHTPRHVF